MSRALLNVAYKRKFKKVKAKRCQFEGCSKALREENKSGYCNRHGNMVHNQKLHKDKRSLLISKDTIREFKEYCDKEGYVMGRKAELILKEFLTNQMA